MPNPESTPTTGSGRLPDAPCSALTEDSDVEVAPCCHCNGSGIGRPSYYGPDYDRCHHCKGHGYERERVDMENLRCDSDYVAPNDQGQARSEAELPAPTGSAPSRNHTP